MPIDLYNKAVQLLARVAISVHERETKSPNLLCFSANEVQVVEEWIKEFLMETSK